MPKYETHLVFNILSFAILSYLVLKFDVLEILNLAIIFVGFLFGTVYVTPDLDTKSKPYNRAPQLWYIYRVLMPHRGNSHEISGIFVRLFYLLIIILGIAVMIGGLDILYTIYGYATLIQPIYYLMLVLGIVIGNFLHIFLDWIT